MSLKNLHSLINGKWFIEDSFGKALLPSLFSALENKKFKKQDIIDHSIIQKSNLIAGAISGSSFNSSDNKEDYVLILGIKSPIYKYNQECGPRGTKSKIATMRAYENDAHCKGVVLDIDSGGGQVSGTPEFHDFIKAYSKPVVAYTDGYMCSAAYYIGAASSHIVANKRADKIGSIGTMVSFLDMTGYYEKKGAKLITAYATKSTDKNKNFEELVAGNPEGYIKNELDPITDTFHKDMTDARTNLADTVLSGGTFNPETSLNLGLIDEIGTLKTAIDKVYELAGKTQNNTNQNSQNMSKKYEKIQAALGLEVAFESNDQGIYLSEEHFQALEDVIAGTETAVEEAEAVIQGNLDALKATNDATITAIDAALESAEIERGTLTDAEAIEALSAKVTEYGQLDGAQTTTVVDDATPGTETTAKVISGVNIEEALNC